VEHSGPLVPVEEHPRRRPSDSNLSERWSVPARYSITDAHNRSTGLLNKRMSGLKDGSDRVTDPMHSSSDVRLTPAGGVQQTKNILFRGLRLRVRRACLHFRFTSQHIHDAPLTRNKPPHFFCSAPWMWAVRKP
jgi:hypothetical protein